MLNNTGIFPWGWFMFFGMTAFGILGLIALVLLIIWLAKQIKRG